MNDFFIMEFTHTEENLKQQLLDTEAGKRELQRELENRRNSISSKEEHLTMLQDKVCNISNFPHLLNGCKFLFLSKGLPIDRYSHTETWV